MGRTPCCSKVGLHRGPWTAREDALLTKYIQVNGEGHWRSLPKKAGLLRCGKSCRLRWMNYLRPDIKRGNITPDEDDLIIRLHSLLGNRWSLIAGRLPGRTDNEIKNYWNTHLSKRLRSQGTDPNTHRKLSQSDLDPRKRRNTKYSNKKRQNNKPQQEVEKIKIHLPKPVRLTSLSLSRNSSFDCNSSHGGEGIIPWTSFKDGSDGASFLIAEGDHHDLVNGSDIECPYRTPSTNNMLEDLYDEYLKLLKTDEEQFQLDSFAESLLI